MSEESTALVKIREAGRLDVERFPDERILAIKAMCAPAAKGTSTLAMFLSTCQHYELDPMLREAWLGEFKGKPTVITGRDGYLKVAQRDPEYRGFDCGVVRQKDEFRLERHGNEVTVHHVMPAFDRGEILGAYAVVHHATRRPVVETRAWKDMGHLTGKDVWKQNPEDMIETRALTAALKKQFNIGGLYTEADGPAAPGTGGGADLEDLTARIQQNGHAPQPAQESEAEEDDGIQEAEFEIVDEEAEEPEAAVVEAEPVAEAEPAADSEQKEERGELTGKTKDQLNADYFRRLNEMGEISEFNRKSWQQSQVGKASCTTWEAADYELAITLLERGNAPAVEAAAEEAPDLPAMLEQARTAAQKTPGKWVKNEQGGVTVSWRIEGDTELCASKGVDPAAVEAALPDGLAVDGMDDKGAGKVYTLKALETAPAEAVDDGSMPW